jgi:hypothetical protein
MDIIHRHQIKFEELFSVKFDILIAACSSESRCNYLAQIPNIKAERKIALVFEENSDLLSRKVNEEIFKANLFECYQISAFSATEIIDVLRQICHSSECDQVKLLIDYSSMTNICYGFIINYLVFNNLDIHHLEVYFLYTPEDSIYKAIEVKKMIKPAPVFFNRTLINTEKPVALVIGLGFNEEKIEFIVDFFKSINVLFFLPNSFVVADYSKLVRQQNENILKMAGKNNVYQYDASNIEEIDAKLTSICLNLRINYRIIIFSFGPKTFSLASFLLNARYPDIEIWYLPNNESIVDYKPTGVPMVYKAILTSE